MSFEQTPVRAHPDHLRPLDPRSPEASQRAAHRARMIIDAGRRAELATAAEFLYLVLRIPDQDGARSDNGGNGGLG